jgi:hypothetical protein
MKSLPLLALMLAWAECSAANAASLSLTQNGNIFSLYIAGEEDNGNFDTVDVAISPTVGATFVNIDGGLDGLFGARPRPCPRWRRLDRPRLHQHCDWLWLRWRPAWPNDQHGR